MPTEIPTEVPPAPPVPRELTLYPISDTSVSAVAPDAAQDPATVGTLIAGGPDGAQAFLTFAVTGIAPGTVVNAQLVLTGAGETAGAAGTLGALPDVAIDEASLTYNTLPSYAASPAVSAGGAAVTVDWIEPYVELWLDLTGTVAADGTVTFVLTGNPDSAVAIASRESATPPRLVLTVVDPAPVAARLSRFRAT